MDRGYTWIDTVDELVRFLNTIEGVVAVDTEGDRAHAYFPKICLIQLATEQETALVDPLRLGKDGLQPLFRVFQDQNIVKIFHSAQNDLRSLDRTYKFKLQNLFDTQVAMIFLHEEKTGLAHLLSSYFGVRTNKKYQTYNWAQRPIDLSACQYAARDVDYLIETRKIQTEQLEKNGWLEPFCQYCRYVVETSHYSPIEFDSDGWARMKGVKQLDAQGRLILRDLYLMRHEYCSKYDISAYRVAPNEALMFVAKNKPQKLKFIRGIKSFACLFLQRNATRILSIVNRSLRGKGISMPLPAERKKTAPPPCDDGFTYQRYYEERTCQAKLFDKLREWRNETAESLELPEHYVASNDTLSAIVKLQPESVDDIGESDLLLPWQFERFGETIFSLLVS